MLFIYKTKDGHTGMVKDVDALPSNLDKLIVRRYNGCVIELPYVDELVLDCNRGDIYSILFKCDTLSIYKPDVNWFHINNVWGDGGKSNSTFNTLIRLKAELIKDVIGMLKNTLCSNITTVLDLTTIKNNQQEATVLVVDMFHNTRLTTIPKIINPPAVQYTKIFRGTDIHRDKLKAADRLLALGKKENHHEVHI